MTRSEFLQLTGKFGLTAPFFLNGIAARASHYLEGFDVPAGCIDVSERVVVIVRLAGANDGLNTIIPVNQYNTYANIRPNIRIADTGTGAYINLDSTLPNEKLCGLHPSMVGFKSLYDSGKLAVLPGVGYPAPNYSHFASENTMFAGKDGNSNEKLDDGMFGRYLASVFPNLAGSPNSQNQDPLAIHMGSSNPCLFYGHTHEIGIEYNISSLQNQLWATPDFPQMQLPDISEHAELLDFITFMEKSKDVYYSRVIDNFNSGANSGVTYPDTTLGKQLKTVARMMKGGSKTKIFQVTLGGFDTHVNQVQAGSTELGTHATLLGNLSDSIAAFQTDLENLGLADRVMTVTFSEFGRQVRQNANLGCDHGNISPFFVVGKQAQAGVLSNHPLLPATGFQYDVAERKFDYRQLFATLLQDWLGSDDNTMRVAELDQFSTPAQKLPLLKPAAVVPPNCYVSNLVVCQQQSETIVAIPTVTDGDWTYYAPDGYTGNNYLIGIQHLPPEIGGNINPFTAEVIFSKKECDPVANPLVHKAINVPATEGTFVSGYYFNFNILSGKLNGHVNIRFFPMDNYTVALNTAATDFENSLPGQPQSTLTYIRSASTPFSFAGDLKNDGTGISPSFYLVPVNATGNYLGYDYVQFNGIMSIHNTGIAAIRKLNIDVSANAPRTTYVFTGNGNFSGATNWHNNHTPMNRTNDNIDIIIDPIEGGFCKMNINFPLLPGMNLIVRPGKILLAD